ncbi:hypothetical protein B5M09_003010 [Aphanomyces astaci]|uniref:Rhodanese domain-containing protein n=2 Tax=Aphanomyces astaci TaxID=112090 RepID=A0A425DBG4_APHAT|nr:hypothetical protein B5M09_003010 [Aphanomyces astaci]
MTSISMHIFGTNEMAQQVDRITAKELVEILKNPEARNAVRIVDVRDGDFAGGHIRGAINVPEEHFHDDDDVDNFVDEMKTVPTIIFHCMMSQVRGPFCAHRFQSRVNAVLEHAAIKPKVLVLTGGFQLFRQNYSHDDDLVEGLPKEGDY